MTPHPRPSLTPQHLAAARTSARLPARAAAILALATCPLFGCHRSPSFNVLGSYFPGWIACIVFAVLLTAGLRALAKHLGIEAHIPMLPLFYSSLALFFACAFWLIIFV